MTIWFPHELRWQPTNINQNTIPKEKNEQRLRIIAIRMRGIEGAFTTYYSRHFLGHHSPMYMGIPQVISEVLDINSLRTNVKII